MNIKKVKMIERRRLRLRRRNNKTISIMGIFSYNRNDLFSRRGKKSSFWELGKPVEW
jgi:hypothetical protein